MHAGRQARLTCSAAYAGGRLHQEPAPELVALRLSRQRHVSNDACSLPHTAGLRLPEVAGPSADLGFTLQRGQSSAAGLLLRAWLHADREVAVPTAAAVVVDWEDCTLEASSICDHASFAVRWWPKLTMVTLSMHACLGMNICLP